MLTRQITRQPTLNPDNSLWRDIAIFNKFDIQVSREYSRGDIVALKYALSQLGFTPIHSFN